MKTFYIIALLLHLLDDKRIESKIDTQAFLIQTVTEII